MFQVRSSVVVSVSVFLLCGSLSLLVLVVKVSLHWLLITKNKTERRIYEVCGQLY